MFELPTISETIDFAYHHIKGTRSPQNQWAAVAGVLCKGALCTGAQRI